MKRQISLSQYRAIDIGILTAVLAAYQLLIHFAVSCWYPEQLYVVSPAAGMTALVMMRWNGYAAIPAMIGGVLFTALSGGNMQQYVIYGVGNLLSLLALAMFKMLGKERIRSDAFLSLAFAFLTQLFMQLGRLGLAALFGYPAAACLAFITTDALSYLFTLLIVWIVRRIDGLFEDQRSYLLRIQKEQQDERGEQF